MLDVVTKRNIDTARDILVGKVPDPKSQVEQITIALIYKFMDDIDSESEELGGKREFFAGQFAKYRWPNLVGPGVGGHDALNLYSEAIARMPENPGIPQLFRNIFNNAYLPYRDPETLRAFLKIIDDFTYDDSESLGDAFEYLLSVLDAQGDAGQFRTPRHIIDFIVAIVDPKKDEVILDPACGTAGFLISSYKHILKANTDSEDQSTLTPDERGRLVNNFNGYDISPDFVRLSLVNMYLHGFREPNIHEYDTLTSEDNWNEYADVILANPPFMSPKGGIRPHNRFSVKSKRSEVLFVDYMAEHLTANGRAGIIVPEGVIFQSQKAHKELRKMLVENYLVAVVSLPAGVFNPYSGVKTSILILDRTLAKRTDSIAFFKVESDGFDLGAQRRPIDENDLPAVQKELIEHLNSLRAAEPETAPHAVASGITEAKARYATNEPKFGMVVEKSKIAEDVNYSLSSQRYEEQAVLFTDYPWCRIGTLVKTITPPTKLKRTTFGTAGRYPIIDQSQVDIAGWTDEESSLVYPEKPLVIFGDHTCAVKLARTAFAQGADGIKILQTVDSLDPLFLYYVLRVHPLDSSGYQRHFARLKRVEVPLPPLEVQHEIVEQIEAYQKVIDGARAVVDNYRPHINVAPRWSKVALEDLFRRSHESVLPNTLDGPATYVGLEDITQNTGLLRGSAVIEEPARLRSQKTVFRAGDILYGRLRPNLNKVWLADRDGFCSTDILVIRPSVNNVLSEFYACLLRGHEFNSSVLRRVTGAQLPRINWANFRLLEVPVPPLEIQQQIVAELETEQALVTANQELIDRFERKIEAAIARVWQQA